MTIVVPGLELKVLDNNLAPIKKINISIADAAFLIAEKNSPVLNGNVVIKEMKKDNEVYKITPIDGETINYGNTVYFDLAIFPDLNFKLKVNKVSLNLSDVKISDDENTKYGVLPEPFGEMEGTLIKDSQLSVNDNNINLNLENFNVVLGDNSNTYKDGVYVRFKFEVLDK